MRACLPRRPPLTADVDAPLPQPPSLANSQAGVSIIKAYILLLLPETCIIEQLFDLLLTFCLQSHGKLATHLLYRMYKNVVLMSFLSIVLSKKMENHIKINSPSAKYGLWQ
ncbi:hypothetical protein Taro_003458 [Colocasia esculenta]|uniref:Uncharacterized protein n=1 Tax=Colocasia esculenta TaxID=4460 RepID=A0A843TP11_COLES|nr:hypothetical protein [Colocasia esculenta]